MDKSTPPKESDKEDLLGASDSSESLEYNGPVVEPSRPDIPQREPRKISKRALIISGAAVLVILVGLTIFAVTRPSSSKKPSEVSDNQTNQTISSDTLKKVIVNGTNSNDVGQITIAPKTLFLNDVAVQGDLNLIKNLNLKGTADVQGAVNLRNGLTVTGPLSLKGPANFGGNLSVSGNITTGGLSVGSLSVANATISSNLTVGGHIIPTGSTPSIVANAGAGGGSATISGNDTAGTITINTGGGPGAGEMATVTFKTAFGTTPKVQITPVNSSAAQLQYYASRSARFFIISSANAPGAGVSYTYDYLVTQ